MSVIGGSDPIIVDRPRKELAFGQHPVILDRGLCGCGVGYLKLCEIIINIPVNTIRRKVPHNDIRSVMPMSTAQFYPCRRCWASKCRGL